MCGLEWGKIVIDLLKALLWPGALVWAAWYYREDIRALAVRVKELGISKVEFAPAVQTIAPEGSSVSSTLPVPTEKTAGDAAAVATGVKLSVAEIRSAISPDQLDPQIAMIREHLPSDISSDPKDTIDYLMHVAASLNIQLFHERIYRMIYGTQLGFLLRINVQGGADDAGATAAYAAATTQFPAMYPTPTSFEQWIAFVINWSLAVRTPGSRYELTPLGRGFLRYIIDNRLVPERPY